MLRFRHLALALAVLASVATLAPATAGAQTPNPIHPDNRASSVPGHTNGALPEALLRYASPDCLIYAPAAPSLITMMADARKDGIILTPSDCYRDYAGQVAMREYWCSQGACHMAAVPGTSNHGWAKAADLRDQDGGLTFTSRGYLWLKANAHRYGWNHPGVMEPNGPVPEPWHWEWVGDGGTMFPGISYGIGRGIGLRADGWPEGNLDLVEAKSVNGWAGTMRAAGWTIDPNTTAPISTHVWINFRDVAVIRADKPRPDVAELMAGYAASPHGFDHEIPLLYGYNQVCAFGINQSGPGANTMVGCKYVSIGTSPIGSLDSVTPGAGGAQVRGWTIDAQTPDPITVEITVNGFVAHRGLANANRPDVTGVFAGHARPGFDVTVPIPHGRSTVCAKSINVGAGADVSLGCKEIESSRNPFGYLDIARGAAGGVEVVGWAIDPDTTAPIEVHVYVGASGTAISANAFRPDVGAAFPGFGDNHGFKAVIPAPGGIHNVCAFAINVAAGTGHTWLGCKNVTL